ncbi:MAG: flagellar hook assembly protein FlgD [Rhodocyclaceae bacterium]|nr:flagellar hook assembly protein FlgD [Rhodocyclaceae bacterium]
MSAVAASNPASREQIWAALSSQQGGRQSSSGIEEAQNRFLKLLTTQLKNQDPLNPLDNAELTSQLAQISTVNGIEKLNALVEKLYASLGKNQAMQAAALINRGVLAPGDRLVLGEGGKGYAGLELAEAADSVKVTIKDAHGITLRTLELGPQEAGLVTFTWDGTTDAGQPAASGVYRFLVEATKEGRTLSAQALAYGMVEAVGQEKDALRVQVAGLGSFSLDEIRQIF